MRALVCARVHDMILRPRILRPHLGRDWSGSHVRSNPLPIALFPSAVRAQVRTCVRATVSRDGENPAQRGDTVTYITIVHREIVPTAVR